MTRIYVSISAPVYAVSFRDHATGSRETCAGISALMYALEGYLQNHESDIVDHDASIPDDNRDARCHIRFETKEPAVIGAFECFLIGLLQIQNSYPDYCKVIVT